MTLQKEEQKFISEYKSIKDFLEAWGKEATRKIREIVDSNDFANYVKIAPSYRLKTEDSLVAKAFYRNKPYKEPLLDIEDKIGSRIVLLKSEDVYKFAGFLEQQGNWECKVTKDISQILKDNPKVFDYQSVHLVVWPKIGHKAYPPDRLKYLTCEIQVRTLLQHAFAEVSHDSTYKGPYKNDNEISRHLAKSMALMEATDDYFCEIFDMVSSETRYFGAFKKELDILFIGLGFSLPEYYDIDFLDIVFELLVTLKVDLNAVELLINKEQSKIKTAIKANKNHLFGQPAILLLYYYLINHRDFLKEHLNIDKKVMESLFNGFGHSTGTT